MDWFKGNKIQYNSIFHGKIYAFNGKIYGFNEKIYGFNGNIYGFNKEIYGCRLRFSLQPILWFMNKLGLNQMMGKYQLEHLTN